MAKRNIVEQTETIEQENMARNPAFHEEGGDNITLNPENRTDPNVSPINKEGEAMTEQQAMIGHNMPPTDTSAQEKEEKLREITKIAREVFALTKKAGDKTQLLAHACEQFYSLAESGWNDISPYTKETFTDQTRAAMQRDLRAYMEKTTGYSETEGHYATSNDGAFNVLLLQASRIAAMAYVGFMGVTWLPEKACYGVPAKVLYPTLKTPQMNTVTGKSETVEIANTDETPIKLTAVLANALYTGDKNTGREGFTGYLKTTRGRPTKEEAPTINGEQQQSGRAGGTTTPQQETPAQQPATNGNKAEEKDKTPSPTQEEQDKRETKPTRPIEPVSIVFRTPDDAEAKHAVVIEIKPEHQPDKAAINRIVQCDMIDVATAFLAKLTAAKKNGLLNKEATYLRGTFQEIAMLLDACEEMAEAQERQAERKRK